VDIRSTVVFLIFSYFTFKAFKAPHIGVMVMAWVGYMNPHRLVPWGFIYSLPLAAIAFAATFIGYIMLKDKPKFVWHTPSILLVVFLIWCSLTTFTSMGSNPTYELNRFFKILLTVAMALLIIREKKHIIILITVIAASIGFYSTKGGVFAVLTGGSFRVWGPPDSFIEGNNELALATLMVIPLMFFLVSQVTNKWFKRALVAVILLSLLSVIASYSRGAFLAMIATSGFLWLKSKYKLQLAMVGFVLVIVTIPMIPQQWYDRMNTIDTYEDDSSAMGRINAWTTAFNMANNRLMGGGFGGFTRVTFLLYAPNPDDYHDAHSIYFEVLGEQGWVGLAIFLGILFSAWRLATLNIKLAKAREEFQWAANLSRMVQVSMVAYMSGGAFLGLAFWDLPYHLVSIVILVNLWLIRSKDLVENPPGIRPQKKVICPDTGRTTWQ
jgi:putative inorganic carbon (HCO3(-)) transporter